MTGKIEWTSSFSVGVGKLDAQHKRLMAICNALGENAYKDTQEADAQFFLDLNELPDYARMHFEDEEAMLESAGYAGITRQYAEHEGFLSFLSQTLAEAERGKLNKAAIQRFIAEWWAHHILEEDMLYREVIGTQSRAANDSNFPWRKAGR